MNYGEVIQKGIRYLKSSQNPDGGIPIRGIDDNSGYWTTAEALEAIVSTVYLIMNTDYLRFLIKMVSYLLAGQYVINDKGYWKEEDNPNARPSTVTTAHVIYALKLCQNNVFGEDDDIKVSIGEKDYSIIELNSTIEDAVKKGTNWLLSIKNSDDGWGRDEQNGSNVLCTYYVLKGLSAVGKNAGSDHSVKEACYYLKRTVKEVLKKENTNLDYEDLIILLYGYSGMKLAGYFQIHDKLFEEKIVKFINVNWASIYSQCLAEQQQHSRLIEGYDLNLPWITLNVLLSFGIFEANEKRIKGLLEWYTNHQHDEGFWCIEEVKRTFYDDCRQSQQEEESTFVNEVITTWITAEIINDFNLAQTRFVQYEADVVTPKKVRLGSAFIIILLAIDLIGFVSFLYMIVSGNGSVYEKLFTAIVTLIGLISSVVTIYTFVNNN